MARKRKVLVQDINREQAEDAFGKYADADAKQQQITAKMDVAITKIRDKYADDLAKLEEIKEKSFEEIQVFAESNIELFEKKKSMEMAHGIIGFRTGTPKLKTRKGFTWSAVNQLLKEFAPDYVRTKEEPAKDKLLADREEPTLKELFPKVGITVVQDEAFFVEPKKEEIVTN